MINNLYFVRHLFIFLFQKKRLKLNADGEVIEGAEDDSSQMSDMHVTVIDPATGMSS